MVTRRYLGYEKLEGSNGGVLVSSKVQTLYQPRLRETGDAAEKYERFQWNRLNGRNDYNRYLVFGYKKAVAGVIDNLNPPIPGLTESNWVNMAPPIFWQTDRLTPDQIARRAVYGHERMTDMRLRPAFAVGLLAARQLISYKTGYYVGEELPLYGLDSTLGGVLGRVAFYWTIDQGAREARSVVRNGESTAFFNQVFEFPGARLIDD